jgi:hypothetical protein
MNDRTRAVALIVIQVLLVSSIGGKYLYERATRPRVWVRTGQYDPNLPMRGRYLALTALVDACELVRGKPSSSSYWHVRTVAKDGKLVAVDAGETPLDDTQRVRVGQEQDCDRVPLSPPMLFFIADTAKSPSPVPAGSELWAEVTVPPMGPPRPIQLAISTNGQWHPLDFK